MEVQIKKVRSCAVIPAAATPDSAGYDLYAANDAPIEIPVGEIRMIPTGIAIAPDRKDIVALVFPRSGLAAKFGITLANSVGVIDSDYRGEIKVPLINHGQQPFTVTCGTRIAQLIFTPILRPQWLETDTLDDTQRGVSGFGSSGL